MIFHLYVRIVILVISVTLLNGIFDILRLTLISILLCLCSPAKTLRDSRDFYHDLLVLLHLCQPMREALRFQKKALVVTVVGIIQQNKHITTLYFGLRIILYVNNLILIDAVASSAQYEFRTMVVQSENDFIVVVQFREIEAEEILPRRREYNDICVCHSNRYV